MVVSRNIEAGFARTIRDVTRDWAIFRDPWLPVGVRVIVPKYSVDSSCQGYAEHVCEQLAFCLPSMDDQSRLTDTQLPGKCFRTYLTGKVIVSVLESIDDDSLLLLGQEPKGG